MLPSIPPPSGWLNLRSLGAGFPPPRTPALLLGWATSFIPHFLSTYGCLGRKPVDTEPLVVPGSLWGAVALSKGLQVQPLTGGCDLYPMLQS